MVTFVQATFVLATFVHIRNISGPDYDETLKIGSLEHLEQIPTVTLTFVQATFVLVTFVHFRKISAVNLVYTQLVKHQLIFLSKTEKPVSGT